VSVKFLITARHRLEEATARVGKQMDRRRAPSWVGSVVISSRSVSAEQKKAKNLKKPLKTLKGKNNILLPHAARSSVLTAKKKKKNNNDENLSINPEQQFLFRCLSLSLGRSRSAPISGATPPPTLPTLPTLQKFRRSVQTLSETTSFPTQKYIVCMYLGISVFLPPSLLLPPNSPPPILPPRKVHCYAT